MSCVPRKDVVFFIDLGQHTQDGRPDRRVLQSRGLYGGITVQDLLSDDYVSQSRNKLAAAAFKAADIIERYGSGIMRVRN